MYIAEFFIVMTYNLCYRLKHAHSHDRRKGKYSMFCCLDQVYFYFYRFLKSRSYV